MTGCHIDLTPGMQPVTVTATLAGGVVSGHRWGIALDGLLAAQLWAQIVDTTDPDLVPWPSLTPVPPDLDLPLARCHTTDTAGQDCWHWAATCAHTPTTTPQVRYRYRPTPNRLLEHTTSSMPGTINPGTRWARREVPDLAQACRHLTWQAVGDPNRIRSLLAPVTAIGKGRQHGEGHILSWTITPHPNPSADDVWRHAHLHPDNTLGRPTPPACLPTDLAATHPPMLAGLRPPLMHPSRQHLLCTPHP